jgi:hypothetical protein
MAKQTVVPIKRQLTGSRSTERGRIIDADFEPELTRVRHLSAVSCTMPDRYYECTTLESSCEPLVRSLQTKKWFALSLPALVKLAVDAGIDEESPDDGNAQT